MGTSNRFFTSVQNGKTNKINRQYYFIEKGLRFAILAIIKEQKKNPCSEINREECFKLYKEYNKINDKTNY